MPIKRLFCVSGLGADERLFQNVHIPEVEKVHIKWIPTTKGESLEAYCQKLTAQVQSTEESAILGVSFGGIVAQEMAKLLDFKKTIIVSSVKSMHEFDWTFNLLRWTRLDRFMPTDKKIIARTHGITEKIFGVKTEKEHKILRGVLEDLDPVFLKWAVGALMKWKQRVPPEGIVHIHGDADLVFSVKKINNYINIAKGTHLILLNRATEISTIIHTQLKT